MNTVVNVLLCVIAGFTLCSCTGSIGNPTELTGTWQRKYREEVSDIENQNITRYTYEFDSDGTYTYTVKTEYKPGDNEYTTVTSGTFYGTPLFFLRDKTVTLITEKTETTSLISGSSTTSTTYETNTTTYYYDILSTGEHHYLQLQSASVNAPVEYKKQ